LTGPFKEAFRRTLGHEGGYSDDPDDNGNWTGGKKGVGELKGTKFGISAASYPAIDIKALTIEQASALYYRDFWRPLGLDEIPNLDIACEIFDTAVNTGTGTAVRIAQRSVKFLGEDIAVDGKPGSDTIKALVRWSKKDPQSLFKALNGYQFMRYAEIVETSPKQGKFSCGWLKRIQEYRRM
jgi:lysozyme family protein